MAYYITRPCMLHFRGLFIKKDGRAITEKKHRIRTKYNITSTKVFTGNWRLVFSY